MSRQVDGRSGGVGGILAWIGRRLGASGRRPTLRGRRGVSPTVEGMEGRVALSSWGSVPPSTVSLRNVPGYTLDQNGDAARTATISGNAVRWRSFVAPRSGTYYIIAFTPTSRVDTVLGVYNGSGRRIAYSDDLMPRFTDSGVAVSLRAGETVFFGIARHRSTSATGSYTWLIDGPARSSSYSAPRSRVRGYDAWVMDGLRQSRENFSSAAQGMFDSLSRRLT